LTGPAIERRWLLLDKSALAREPDLDPALGEPCLCAITRFEVLYSARSPGAFEQLETELDALHELHVDVETMTIARTAQHALAAMSHHRVPIPDLLIAACAQQHQAAVLHLDRHYETLARVLSFTPVRMEQRRPE
jgi:predicted nucleic acid-binding protein